MEFAKVAGCQVVGNNALKGKFYRDWGGVGTWVMWGLSGVRVGCSWIVGS